LFFSVIIPTRNRPEFLGDAVASVLRQRDVSLELIIVNDGTVPVADFSDNRVRVISSGEAGAVPARNLGVAATSGNVIAFLDDDDQWTDDFWLKRAFDAMTQGADFVFGDGRMACPDGQSKSFAEDADATSLARDNTILISSVCYRKSLHDMLGSFDESLPYYWDWDWYIRVARSGAKLQRIASPVVDIRIHAANMSGDKNAEARLENLARLAQKHGLGPLKLKSHMDFV
jgi:glycosyltransferase involved in cell wall biosynthesis